MPRTHPLKEDDNRITVSTANDNTAEDVADSESDDDDTDDNTCERNDVDNEADNDEVDDTYTRESGLDSRSCQSDSAPGLRRSTRSRRQPYSICAICES